MCRYNLSIANSSMSKEFSFTRADMGAIITTALLAYAFGQILNGLLTDKIGGKRAMLIGAVGTIAMNILFGAATMWGHFAPAARHGEVFYETRPSVEFAAEDFQDVKALAKKLDRATNSISAFLKPQLSEATRRMDAVARTNAVPPELAEALTVDFNRLIHGPAALQYKRVCGRRPLARRHQSARDRHQ